MRIGFGEPKKNKHDQTMQLSESVVLVNVMQIVFLKLQVGIIPLGALYCESIVKMKSPVDLCLSPIHEFLNAASRRY